MPASPRYPAHRRSSPDDMAKGSTCQQDYRLAPSSRREVQKQVVHYSCSRVLPAIRFCAAKPVEPVKAPQGENEMSYSRMASADTSDTPYEPILRAPRVAPADKAATSEV